jgi:hypothetical protein
MHDRLNPATPDVKPVEAGSRVGLVESLKSADSFKGGPEKARNPLSGRRNSGACHGNSWTCRMTPRGVSLSCTILIDLLMVATIMSETVLEELLAFSGKPDLLAQPHSSRVAPVVGIASILLPMPRSAIFARPREPVGIGEPS